MPFKTKKAKSRANEKWSSLSESAKFVYGGSLSGDINSESVSEKVEKQEKDILEVRYVSSELIKIALLASSIIGLQILLKISRIGF